MTENEVTTDLEAVREKIYTLEKELTRYGFDPQRGLETYSVGELKELLRKSENPNEFIKMLKIVIDLQAQFYKLLYQKCGFKELRIDTEMPEKNIVKIKEWLERQANKKKKSEKTDTRASKFDALLAYLMRMLKHEKDSARIAETFYNVLETTYKRTYDVHMFADFVISIYQDYTNDVSLVEKIKTEKDYTKKAIKLVVTKLIEDRNFYVYFYEKVAQRIRRGHT